ncbi:MAG: DUF3086 domain-containing protein, partial [Spirulina sp. DLM2.Bin59]
QPQETPPPPGQESPSELVAHREGEQGEAAQGEAIATAQAQLTELTTQAEALKAQVAELQETVADLEARRQARLADEGKNLPELITALVDESLGRLAKQRQALTAEVAKLEARRDRLAAETRKTFTGTSEEIAIRLQGFKNYLIGSLQDLAAAAEQIDLPEPQIIPAPAPEIRAAPAAPSSPEFAKQQFQDQRRQITSILDQYRTMPDYYGPPWQLRRTFEPVHADRVQTWFFKQGGRGTIRSLGSRLQNILVASAAISALRRIYGDRLQVLVLANTPERLGEWRRGLQDCLGISRSDYGPTRGVALFEAPEVLAQKAERLVETEGLPLIIMDETEEMISLALLQFPLWMAFAPDPAQASNYLY